MKKILIVLAVIFLLAASALAVFFFTFDLDRYRPVIVRQAEKTLGVPVSIGHLALTWQGGLAVSVNRLVVYDPATKKNAVASVDQAALTLRLLPLLRKSVEISSISVTHPVVQP